VGSSYNQKLYRDFYPLNEVGRIIAVLVMFSGIGIVVSVLTLLSQTSYNFQGKGQYGADGKLRDIITDLQTNATGKLAFLGNVVVIDKNEIDKAGNAITKYWELK